MSCLQLHSFQSIFYFCEYLFYSIFRNVYFDFQIYLDFIVFLYCWFQIEFDSGQKTDLLFNPADDYYLKIMCILSSFIEVWHRVYSTEFVIHVARVLSCLRESRSTSSTVIVSFPFSLFHSFSFVSYDRHDGFASGNFFAIIYPNIFILPS